MIISHKHKFIFIKTEKTAGTSVEIALSKICGPDDIITPISEEDEAYRKELGYPSQQNFRPSYTSLLKPSFAFSYALTREFDFYNHIAGIDVKRRISSKVWNSYFKFCFERNPYDKYVSWYYWKLGIGKKFAADRKDFMNGPAQYVKGWELYTKNDVPIVDKIYKYEDLRGAIADINKTLGLKDEIALPVKKAKGNIRKNKSHYRDILFEHEKEWISQRFAKEISHFNYEY